MSRESRLLAILAVIAAIGVSSLMLVARQYRTALGAHTVPGSAAAEDAPAEALRLVDGFLAARKAALAVVSFDAIETSGRRTSASAESIRSYRIERFKALAARGMTYEDYAAVRSAWRAFRAGKPPTDPALRSAFRARAKALEDAALGPLEALDDDEVK